MALISSKETNNEETKLKQCEEAQDVKRENQNQTNIYEYFQEPRISVIKEITNT